MKGSITVNLGADRSSNKTLKANKMMLNGKLSTIQLLTQSLSLILACSRVETIGIATVASLSGKVGIHVILQTKWTNNAI